MTTKVTDSVMDLSNVQQDIVLNGQKITGVTASPTLDDEATSKKYVDDTIETLLEIKVPAGMGPLAWSGSTAPTGWLMCDGQAVSRTTYSELFDVVDIKYGNGDGSTTFNVPDMRGRFPLGKTTTGLNDANRVDRSQAHTLGEISGVEYYKLQLEHLPSHDHTATISSSGSHIHGGATTGYESDHSHTTDPATSDVFDPTGNGSGTDNGSSTVRAMTIQPAGGHDHTVTVPTNSSSHSHPVVVAATAAPTEHENTPPFLTLNYIIKY